MTHKLIFVHGTGVRHDQTHQLVINGLRDIGRKDIDVLGIPWGDRFGVKLTDGDLADILPPGARGVGDAIDDGQVEAGLWSLLLEDPLFELRILAVKPPSAAIAALGTFPGVLSPDQDLASRLMALVLNVAAPGGVPSGEVQAAAQRLASQTPLLDAANAVGDANDPDLLDAVARAVTASALAPYRAQAQGSGGPDALFLHSDRTDLTAVILAAIAPGGRGVVGWLLGKVKEFALARATELARERRDGLMQGASPGMGDILLYLRRGDEISRMVLDAIAEIPDGTDIVLLGHSLGGIILFDLLTGGAVKKPIKHFISVGSQSPFFYKCDALETVRLGHGHPFTPWLNIFDRNDLLSFRAEAAFANLVGIKDMEASSGSPFPEAHSAYFRMPEIYQAVADRCPR